MVYILLGTGFEETEVVAPLDLLRRAGIETATVGVSGSTVYSSRNIGIVADMTLAEVDLTNLDMVVLPGGLGGVAAVRASEQAMQLLKFAWENGKYVAAICAGPSVLATLGITDGKQVTCYPGFEEKMGSATVRTDIPAIRDGMLITGASCGCAIPFGLELVKALRGEDAARQVAQEIVIR
ncbi:MAG: DJ-1/PfpI family protein [Firmicutes bacterium]|nr:DJ-1/PfpI family protein [Bacillota bacterium]